ncbi:MAG: hypothetical protein K0U52_07130 [Gammaproteobacteria bacterium]|nr:hypothetical protein [Gammaproteobacteria bacterium]
MATVVHQDHGDTAREFVRLIREAQHTIYYSAFICQPDYELPIASSNSSSPYASNTTLAKEFTDAANRGVQIHILYSPETSHGNYPLKKFIGFFPKSVEIHTVHGSGDLHPMVTLLTKSKTYTNHHQKYLCVDGATMMVTGTDLDKGRSAWLTQNAFGYYWHEVSVSLPCTSEMFDWVKANHANICPPPFPLTAAESEHDIIVNMIRTAKSSVHMEAQICVSSEDTYNEVFKAVADRLVQAYQSAAADPFVFFLITNVEQVDESQIVSTIMKYDVLFSRRYLREETGKFDVPWSFVTSRMCMMELLCHASGEEKTVKIHSNFILKDGHTLLRTSSNLSDRSMSDHPCDTEVGVLVDDASVVGPFQLAMLSKYLNQECASVHDFFDVVQRDAMSKHPIEIRTITLGNHPSEKTLVKDGTVAKFAKWMHAPKSHGGKVPTTWNVRKASTQFQLPSLNTIVMGVSTLLLLAFVLWYMASKWLAIKADRSGHCMQQSSSSRVSISMEGGRTSNAG